MREIKGTPKNLMGLLQNAKYTVNYYQREYRWQRRQIEELIDDLTTEFLKNYNPVHKRDDMTDYNIYFMGSIILAGRENEIIDGQQRLSSLTLLLMYLRNRLVKLKEHHTTVEQMIYSEVRGTKSFNINVPERQACMMAIFNDDLDNFETNDAIESVQNLCDAYGVIEDNFPSSITDDTLLIFCDWLIEKVFFIEIIAQEESDASKIFITINDRGLSLTSMEMLKSYLLSEIKKSNVREKLNKGWKNKIEALKRDDVNGDEVFIKAWLRAQYADIQTVEEIIDSPQTNLFTELPVTKTEEKFDDFELNGGEFHKWLRDNHSRFNLNKESNWERLIDEFFYFTDVYLKIRKAERTFDEATKYVYYNAQVNFTLQPLFLMAPICYGDKPEVVTEKINLTARFIDLLIIYRVLNKKSLAFNTIKNSIFNITKNIRRLTVKALKAQLKLELQKYCYNMKLLYFAAALPEFRLNQFTKKYIKNILARITSFIEEQTSGTPHYVEYMTTTTDPFEIEHILCDKFEHFTNEFADEEEFARYRNNIGALLLLRKKINASLNDSDYPDKLIKYRSTEGNIYAASLDEEAYKNNPDFKNFIAANNLSFKPFKKFGKEEIEQRVQLVMELANLIWNTEDFK